MTVTKVAITSWDGNESTDDIEYRISYLVTTDDKDDGPSVVKAAMPVLLDDGYASGNDVDSLATLVSVSVTQVDSGDFNHWAVDTIYKSNERRTDPLLEPVQESVSWNGVEVETFRFFDGSPILNTAGMMLDLPVAKVDNRPVVTYTVNQLLFPFALAAQVRNSVNASLWKGFAPRTAKLQSMQTERVFDGKFGVYYKVSYVFEINPETYDLSVDSMGIYQLEDAVAVGEIQGGGRFVAAKPVRQVPVAIQVGGIPIKEPVGLAANGRATSGIAPSLPIATITGQIYEPLDYNTLFPFLQ